MTSSKIFLYFCLSFIGGIFFGSFFNVSQLWMLVFLILGILLISILWSYKKLVIFGFSILFFLVGIWRYQSIERGTRNNQLSKLNDSGEEITLIGIVSAEPDVRKNNLKLTFTPEGMKEKILITTHRYPEYHYGDKLKITGELKTPQKLEEFNYKDYLKKDGIYSIMNWPEIEILERENYQRLTQKIYAKILNFKTQLRGIIYRNLSPPQSSILAAMILGDKRQVSGELKKSLNIAGVRHITAISGLHVTILSSILMTILLGLGFWRQQAFWFSIILIILFIIMTGLQPSPIRAGIMGSLFLFGQYLGRLSVSSRSIIFSAVLMLFQNPLLLKLDVGFQLSFLATMGMIYLMPNFEDWLRKIPDSFQLRSILAITLSAQIFTLPLLIYNFGYISLIAPITNVLIAPFLYWLMFFGFVFAFSGLFWQQLSFFLSLPVWLLLTYVIKIVDISAKIPFASKILEISWFWLMIFYLLLGIITWRLREKQKIKFLQY